MYQAAMPLDSPRRGLAANRMLANVPRINTIASPLMICALTGELRHVEEGRLHLQVGPMVYELLIPAADAPGLLAMIGQELTFHTLMYLEGDPNRGNLEPRLIGFLRREDKRFFELFTTVKGIGPRRALRALAAPVGQIAEAIEAKDARFLVGLPEIGKRTAEQMVAELAGRVKAFVVSTKGRTAAVSTGRRRTPAEEDAITALTQLGERRADAEQLLDRVRQLHPEADGSDLLLREMLRLRTVRAGG
jgi:holliday junction DNA helicase RuvA